MHVSTSRAVRYRASNFEHFYYDYDLFLITQFTAFSWAPLSHEFFYEDCFQAIFIQRNWLNLACEATKQKKFDTSDRENDQS